MNPNSQKKNIILIIILASFGYFVDIYDLVIFSIVRVKSFTEIGIKEAEMLSNTQFVLNMQMAGLLLGGIFWGIIGDKLGRVKVLFGSILIYSLANIANAFVQNIEMYAWIRLIAGIGLAGELGAGITLISETMSKEKRGYGTMIVATTGVLGAVAAFYISEISTWRNAYIIGGILGLILLIFRMGTFESKMFKNAENSEISRGNLLMLFNSKERFLRFLKVILVGAPIWFLVGILITLAPEFGKVLHSTEPLSAGKGILYCYIGISLGDLMAGLLAQILKSRLKTVFIFQILIIIFASIYLNSENLTPEKFNILAFFIGIGTGYWATFATIAAEQFGTNIRATVATSAPNFVRGLLIPITLFFNYIASLSNLISAAYIMLFILCGLAFISIFTLKETFSKDLDYFEK